MGYETPHEPGTPQTPHAPASPGTEAVTPAGGPKMLEAALAYARSGFSVIPHKPRSKSPMVTWKEFQERHATEDEIRGWWGRCPNANIAIVTGTISGLVAIDLDGTEGRASLGTVLNGFEITAPVIQTSRGHYLYFKHPGGKVKTCV